MENDQETAQLIAEMMRLGEENQNAVDANDLGQLAASQFSDPLMGMLFSTMMRQYETRGEERKSREDYERTVVRAKQIIKQLKEELGAARSVAHYFGDVFGACADCWGQHEECPKCGGRGAPGSGYPARSELLALVVPALNKLGLGVTELGSVNGASSNPATVQSHIAKGEH